MGWQLPAFRASRNRTPSSLWGAVARLIVTGVALCPAILGAQAPGDETLLFQDLARVTGASRYEQETADAPAAITIITAEEIRRYGYRTIGEVLANVRGFVMNDDRNYSYVGVRGFAVPGDFNSRVLLLVDGHRVNENVFGSALLGTGGQIDLRVVERIEVVRGPGSSLYGTSALFGVVNIITRQARWLEGVEASATGASYGSRRASVAFGRRLPNGVEVMAHGSAYRANGQNLFFGDFDDPATNNGMAVAADGDQYDRQFAKITAGDFTVQAARSWRRKQIPTGSYQTLFNDPRAQTTDASTFAFLRYGRGFSDVSRLEATLSYHAYSYEGRYPYADGLLSDYGLGRWWSLDADYVRPLGHGHRLVGGVEARWNARQDQGADNVDSGLVVFRSHRTGFVWGLFAQDEWRIARSLLVSAGVRYDRDDNFGGTTNPRLSVVYHVPRVGALKLLVGRAFRAPNAYELDYQDGGLTTKAANGLRAEIIESREVVFEGVPARGLRVTASLFRIQLRDLVTQVVDPADSLLVYRNDGRVRSEGAEVELEVRLAAGMELGASYTHQDVDDPLTGAAVANAPAHLATARFTVPLAGERGRASLAARYVGAQRTTRGTLVPAGTVADLTLLGHPTAWMAISASVYNLFDAAVVNPAGSEQVIAVVPQDGRNVRLGVQVRF